MFSTFLGGGAYATAAAFGFRHGIDWDHIAALTDLTASQPTTRRSMHLATLYAIGHGVMIVVLGVAAIVFAQQLPRSVDGAMERVVGATLIALGAYLVWSLVRHRGHAHPMSRWMLMIAGVRRLTTGERHEAGEPLLAYGNRTAFGIGMLHGIGAETPTQVVVFAAAAHAGGSTASVAVLLWFVLGLVAANTLLAASSTYGFRLLAQRRWPSLVLTTVTAGFSLVLGVLFIMGRSPWLPAILGG